MFKNFIPGNDKRLSFHHFSWTSPKEYHLHTWYVLKPYVKCFILSSNFVLNFISIQVDSFNLYIRNRQLVPNIFERGSISINRKYKVALPVKTGKVEWKIWNQRPRFSQKSTPYNSFRANSYEFKWCNAINLFLPAGNMNDRGQKYIHIKAGSSFSCSNTWQNDFAANGWRCCVFYA